jgi:signal transduction histidine kinase
MTKISENILKTIAETKVRPEPRWKFLVKNWSTLIMFGLSLLIGALSFAVMLDIIVRHDWDIYFYLHKTFLQYALLSLPYVWILLLALFTGVAYYDFIHIRGWYRHRVYLVVLASIFLSVGCGIVFFLAGFGKIIDRALTKNIPAYGLVKVNKEELWNHPDDGLLGGEIIEVRNENEFVLEDATGKQWEIRDSEAILNSKNINKDESVELIGSRGTGDKFVAKKIREADSEKEDEFIKKRETERSKEKKLEKERESKRENKDSDSSDEKDEGRAEKSDEDGD